MRIKKKNWMVYIYRTNRIIIIKVEEVARKKKTARKKSKRKTIEYESYAKYQTYYAILFELIWFITVVVSWLFL